MEQGGSKGEVSGSVCGTSDLRTFVSNNQEGTEGEVSGSDC